MRGTHACQLARALARPHTPTHTHTPTHIHTYTHQHTPTITKTHTHTHTDGHSLSRSSLSPAAFLQHFSICDRGWMCRTCVCDRRVRLIVNLQKFANKYGEGSIIGRGLGHYHPCVAVVKQLNCGLSAWKESFLKPKFSHLLHRSWHLQATTSKTLPNSAWGSSALRNPRYEQDDGGRANFLYRPNAAAPGSLKPS